MITVKFTTDKTDHNLVWHSVNNDNTNESDELIYDAVSSKIFLAVYETGQIKKNPEILERQEVINLCCRFLWYYHLPPDKLTVIFDEEVLNPFSRILDPKGSNRTWLKSKMVEPN